jgi:hypothetical protein
MKTKKKPKITMTVIKESQGYGATAEIGNRFIATQGDTFQELQEMVLEAVNLSFEDEGIMYGIEEIAFTYDLESFFKFYRVINAKALAERIRMNPSLLAQYIKGIKKPSAAQTRRIVEGVRQIGRELSEVRVV